MSRDGRTTVATEGMQGMKLVLTALVLMLGLASLSACGYDQGYGNMSPLKTGGDGPGDIAN